MYELIEKTHLQTIACNNKNINTLLKNKEKKDVLIVVTKKKIMFYVCYINKDPFNTHFTLENGLENLNVVARITARNIYLSNIMSFIIPFHENTNEYHIISANIKKYIGNIVDDIFN